MAGAKLFCVIREDDKRSFEIAMEHAVGSSWVESGPLQIIPVWHWFRQPTLIYVQMLVKYI
jgi:hypothetical protein